MGSRFASYFDRSHLHASSSQIKDKKIGLKRLKIMKIFDCFQYFVGHDARFKATY